MRKMHSLTSVQLPALPCDIEVLLVTSTLQLLDQPDEVYRQTIALVLVHPIPAVRHAARVLAASFYSARASLHAAPIGVDLTEWLAGLVSQDLPDVIVMLVAAGAPLSEVAQSDLADLPSKLDVWLDMQLDLLLWVSDGPSPWPVGRYASIQGDQMSALRVFEVFSLQLAPEVFYCSDIYDLSSVVESGSTCRIFHAHWIVAEQRFVFASNADARCLGECPSVIVAQPNTLQFKDVNAIVKTAKSSLLDSGWSVFIDGQELRTELPSGSGSGVISVLFLARLPG
jgi:hypothetical protein